MQVDEPYDPMSALGHKQTYAPQQAMSALPPIATAKADMPQRAMSAFGGKADMALCCMSAFAVAIGGKADMGLCVAHVRF